MSSHHHFLVLGYPVQGHINPSLQLAKTLARNGGRVTFATTVYGLRSVKDLPAYDGLSFASFSDGYDDEASRGSIDFSKYMSVIRRVGSQTLAALLNNLSDEGRPITFVIYPIMLPWAATVASEFHLPSALFNIQCATAFAIYYRVFNSVDGIAADVDQVDRSVSIVIPKLPVVFSGDDAPTFLFRGCRFHSIMFPCMKEHMSVLERDPKPCVLTNTFDVVETESLKAIPNINVIPIGPLIPSAYSDGDDQKDKSFGFDLFESDRDEYLKWLDTKQENSVVYVSFGSLAQLNPEQKQEMLRGLTESGRPFLWVIRSSPRNSEDRTENGLIVPWCTQVEVLSHKSVGCFVTHCGWNSTLESMAAGVPIVGCPQFSDQPMNAKLVEEVWGNGVRAAANGEGVVEREEIKRCLEIVMGGGEKGKGIRENAMKWKSLAVEAVKEGGSSYNNIKLFMETLA